MSNLKEQGRIIQDNRLVSSYNVQGGLAGVGRSIHVHAVHEMNDVHDIQQFLILSRCTQQVISDYLYPWSLARGLSRSYSLRSVPLELTEAVCFLVYSLCGLKSSLSHYLG